MFNAPQFCLSLAFTSIAAQFKHVFPFWPIFHLTVLLLLLSSSSSSAGSLSQSVFARGGGEREKTTHAHKKEEEGKECADFGSVL